MVTPPTLSSYSGLTGGNYEIEKKNDGKENSPDDQQKKRNLQIQ